MDRFEAKVDRGPGHGPDGDCHVWTGSVTPKGYGHFRLRGTTQQAHRVAFYLAHGRWPVGETRHTCDNRPCVRVEHLLEGTTAQNVRDRTERRRGPRWRLDAAAAQVFIERVAAGEHPTAVGKELGISKSQSWKIAHGDFWKDIRPDLDRPLRVAVKGG